MAQARKNRTAERDHKERFREQLQKDHVWGRIMAGDFLTHQEQEAISACFGGSPKRKGRKPDRALPQLKQMLDWKRIARRVARRRARYARIRRRQPRAHPREVRRNGRPRLLDRDSDWQQTRAGWKIKDPTLAALRHECRQSEAARELVAVIEGYSGDPAHRWNVIKARSKWDKEAIALGERIRERQKPRSIRRLAAAIKRERTYGWRGRSE